MVPVPISAQDKRWMISLQKRIWKVTRDDIGIKHAFPRDGKSLHHMVLHKIKRLFKEHELPCVLHSGPYGGLWIAMYNHVDMPVAPLDHLISLDEAHFGLKGGHKKWDARFEFMSRYTHNDRNRQLASFYGLQTPEHIDCYRY